MKSNKQLNRRSFLRYTAAILGTGTFLASCKEKVVEPVTPPLPTTPSAEPRMATNNISCWGDSLTAGSGGKPYPTILQEAMPNRTVTNYGIGGQRAYQISARQGGRQIEITLEGNAFNGANSVVITKLNTPFLNGSGAIRTSKGKMAGVACEITRTIDSSSGKNVNMYTVKPLDASTVAVPEESIFVPDESILTKADTHILWMGRNDTNNLLPNQVPKEIQLCIDHIERPARFAVMGILNSIKENASAQDLEDLKIYQDILTVNKELAEKYPNNFIPSTPPTVEEMAAVSYTPSEEDKITIANGAFPKGLRSDDIHFNDKGYRIIANRVEAFLKKNVGF